MISDHYIAAAQPDESVGLFGSSPQFYIFSQMYISINILFNNGTRERKGVIIRSQFHLIP